MKQRYNQYSKYIKDTYGERVQKITVDAGFTCPNRDGLLGTGGCIYCNNKSFSPGMRTNLPLEEQIQVGIEAAKKRYKVQKFFIYFQSFTNTYGDIKHLKALYEKALSYEGVIGLSIGTRPDCVDAEKIGLLEQLAKNYEITIEYGLESVFDESLEKINRGHNLKAFDEAIKLTTGKNIKICTHIILGLPWENPKMWSESAKILSKYPIDFLKVHNLHVVKNTPLEEIYANSPFKLISEDEYLEIIIDFLEHLNPEIVIQRLLSDTPKDLLIAPHWKISNNHFLNLLSKEMEKRNSHQGKSYLASP